MLSQPPAKAAGPAHAAVARPLPRPGAGPRGQTKGAPCAALFQCSAAAAGLHLVTSGCRWTPEPGRDGPRMAPRSGPIDSDNERSLGSTRAPTAAWATGPGYRPGPVKPSEPVPVGWAGSRVRGGLEISVEGAHRRVEGSLLSCRGLLPGRHEMRSSMSPITQGKVGLDWRG